MNNKKSNKENLKNFIKYNYNINTFIFNSKNLQVQKLVQIKNKIFDFTNFYQENIYKIKLQENENKIYIIRDNFNLNYLLINFKDEDESICSSPFLIDANYSYEYLEKILIKNNLNTSYIDLLLEYYSSLNVVDIYKLINSVLHFLKILYDDKIFLTEDVEKFIKIDSNFINTAHTENLDLKLYEHIYEIENNFMDSITNADYDKSIYYYSKIDKTRFGINNKSPIEYFKNVYTILNTLLRKSIEKSGVHPYYINEISRKYSLLILNFSNINSFTNLDIKMIKDYISYVQKYSTNGYSTNVKKILNYINLNIYNKINLMEISKNIGLNYSYASRIFKEEVGLNINSYITNKKINIACEMLKNTDLQVQEISNHIGFNDFNYFIKLFKNSVGMTPLKYKYFHTKKST